MTESPKSKEVIESNFTTPKIDAEKDEFDRVAKTFGFESEHLQAEAERGELVLLNDEVWRALENTDSSKFGEGNWNEVESWADKYGRDWQGLKKKMERDSKVDAPIIMKYGDQYHTVSGNTRLMVSRAMGLRPRVWMFEINLHGSS